MVVKKTDHGAAEEPRYPVSGAENAIGRGPTYSAVTLRFQSLKQGTRARYKEGVTGAPSRGMSTMSIPSPSAPMAKLSVAGAIRRN
jgi:hypothetical protein